MILGAVGGCSLFGFIGNPVSESGICIKGSPGSLVLFWGSLSIPVLQLYAVP